MAPHFSTLTWKIPWTEEPGRLQSMGSLRVGHDWVIHTYIKFTILTINCIVQWHWVHSQLWMLCNHHHHLSPELFHLPTHFLQIVGRNSSSWSYRIEVSIWQPTLVFLPRKFQGQRSLVGHTVYGVTKSRTWLSYWAHTHSIFLLARDHF